MSDGGEGRTLQVALRDKEDILVEKALQRIQRAQELGKRNVRLSQSELDALQRKRQREAGREVRSEPRDRRRSSGLPKKPVKKDKPRERKSDILPSKYDTEGSRRPPGILVPGQSDVPVYTPLGYYPQPITARQSKSSGSGSRIASSRDLAQLSPDISHSRLPRSPPSNSSTRSLPDDPQWMPRPRSSSSLSGTPRPSDNDHPYNYQAYSPPLPQMPAHYASQARRIVSNPQPETQNRLPRYEGLAPRVPRQEHSAPEAQEETLSGTSSEHDDSDNGVQVDVVHVPNGRGYEIRTVSEGSLRDRDRRRR